MTGQITIGNQTFDLSKIKSIKKDDASAEGSKLVKHLFANEKWLGGKVDGVLDENELLGFIKKLDKNGDNNISMSEIEEWKDANIASGNKIHQTFTYDDIINLLKTTVGIKSDTSSKKDEYKKIENRQIEGLQEISKLSSKYVDDPETLNKETDALSKDAYKLYKFTPDGYMDMEKDKKFDAYKEAILALGEGMAEEYDTGSTDGQIDIDEFKHMQKGIQRAIIGNQMTSAEAAKLMNSDEFNSYLEDFFSILDIDGSGKLDTKELATQFAYMDNSIVSYNEMFEKIEDGPSYDGRLNIFDGIDFTPGDTESIEAAKNDLKEYYEAFFAA